MYSRKKVKICRKFGERIFPEVKITDEEVYNSVVGSREMKKQASIIVHATVQETSQPFYFKTIFHLNPVISV